MRLTQRDVRLIRDVAMSRVLSRDQVLELGYFGSITRCNTRLRELVKHSALRRLTTPFFAQSLYCVGRLAAELVGQRVSRIIEARIASPRFIQHSMSVSNVRIALRSKAKGEWRFEPQLWRKLTGPYPCEVRPDGLFLGRTPIFVEVDMGHVSAPKFKDKLLAYRALALSGHCAELYGFSTFRLLVVTTGNLRARHLRRLAPPDSGFELLVQTFEEVGATPIECWS